MQVLTLAALGVLLALLALHLREQPLRLLQLGAGVLGVAAGHGLLCLPALARLGAAPRQVLNAVGMALCGHLSGWPPAAWLFLPVHAFWMGRSPVPGSRLRLGALLAGLSAVALVDGAPLAQVVAYVLLAVLAYAITETRVALTRAALEALEAQHAELAKAHAELARAHAQLDVVHERAREQERLSSLGLLAAGIAHEINNPLAFVKSNVHSLSYDLQAQAGLPEELQEYVDDVLPATLDGIQRIVSIVGDLRRFARMDADQMVEYDLNEEARAALRISRSHMHGRCEVVVELGELPRLMG
jgi:signal transduction histidine kinase